MAPVAGHDEVGERFALARGKFALFELVGQGTGVTRVADCDGSDSLPVFGDVEHLARLVGVEAGHLMNMQAVGDRLETQLRAGAANIMEAVRERLAFLVFDLRDGNRKHRRVLRPALIELDHRAQNLVEIVFVVFRGDDVCPRLTVAAGWRPSSSLEEAPEDGGRDRFVAKGARTPTMEHEFVDWRFNGSGVFHWSATFRYGI
jgi:hypothetical protein